MPNGTEELTGTEYSSLPSESFITTTFVCLTKWRLKISFCEIDKSVAELQNPLHTFTQKGRRCECLEMKSDSWHDSLEGRLPLLALRDLRRAAFNNFSSSELSLGVTGLQIFCSSLAARGSVAARAGGMGGGFLCLAVGDARDFGCKVTSAVEGRVSYMLSLLTCWTFFRCILLISCRNKFFLHTTWTGS